MEIWRSGPSGAKVTKSGCVEKSSGSSLRLSADHFSRAATVSRLCGRLRSSCFDLLGVAQQARAQAAGQRGLPHALGTGEEQGLREALLRDHPLQRVRDVRVAPEVVKHTR